MIGGIVWFVCGLLTVYAMYGDKKEIPALKAVLVALFGFVSLFIWLLFNLNKNIKNPFGRE